MPLQSVPVPVACNYVAAEAAVCIWAEEIFYAMFQYYRFIVVVSHLWEEHVRGKN